ncbi:related to ADAM family of metalloprotease ADM-B [Rhynchosporium agropyri]|uniref:Disintegrin and metalloproteinase domain-containing protein B n=1 Tax=Rhynchosporium agropyri TaxID=914238 RepID=A0A1E1LDW1_9HELO|nr:related to ADAM family of metalloprotease ADM-B [Rhynchosporium agropyri]
MRFFSCSSFKVAALASGVLFTVGCVARSEARDRISHVYNVENPIIVTQSQQSHIAHDSSFDLIFNLENDAPRVKLVLEPNRNILSSTAYVNYLDGDGNVRHAEPVIRDAHKVYKGNAWIKTEEGGDDWEEAGWARVYVKRDGEAPLVEGAFTIAGEQHHIQLRSTYMQTKRDGDFHPKDEEDAERMVVYRDRDMKTRKGKRDTEEGRCQSDQLEFNTGPENPLSERDGIMGVSWNSASLGSLASRQLIPGGNSGYGDLRSSIGSTDGCPTSLKIALIGVATDCSYTASFPDAQAVRANIINIVNTASDVYERTFNVALGLQNLTISDAQCPASAADSTPWNVACTTSDDIEVKLSQFSEWRGSRRDSNAYWTLMSGCRSGSVVGIAWLGQLCVSNLRGSGQQSVTGANVVARTSSEWQVFAHESAHTFGAVHDCDASFCAAGATSQCCPLSQSGCDASGQFLMNPTSSRDMSEFSQCTVGNICSMMRSNAVRTRCLVNNVDVPTISGAQCGNGIVETGEQCDCGSAEECGADSCCDPTTCRYRGNAVCDDTNDACCSRCQFTAANTVCRASRGPCDIQEVCSGTTGSCPTDAFQPNGGSCGDATDQFCAEGQCTSRNLQCQQVVIQGTSGNYSNSCDDDLCRLRCSQSTNSQFCTQLNRNLLDGTPCNGGSCNSGRCSNGNDPSTNGGGGGGESVGSWVSRNRGLVIGLAAGLGSLALIVLACCICSCFRKSKKRKASPIPPQRPMMGQQQGWGGPPPPAYPAPAYTTFMNRNNQPLVRYA